MSTIAKFLPKPPDGFSTQIASATVSSSTLSVQLDSATGLPTEGVGQFFKKNASGDLVSGSVEFVHWTNVSGNTLTFSDTGDRGITGSDSGAQSYVADDYFEVWASSYYVGGYGGTVEHSSDGTHSDITATSLKGKSTKFTAASGEYDNGNSGTSMSINWANGDRQLVTMSAACTFTFTGAVKGQTLTLRVVENGTGGFAPTWPTLKWPGGSAVTATTTASAINLFIFYFDGTNYLAQASVGFA